MAKNKPIDVALVERVIAAMKYGWIVGDLTPGEPEKAAVLYVRRWRSYARRGIKQGDREARIRDLARCISFQGDSQLYKRAAERIATVLESDSAA